jgi:hypothetical protein
MTAVRAEKTGYLTPFAVTEDGVDVQPAFVSFIYISFVQRQDPGTGGTQGGVEQFHGVAVVRRVGIGTQEGEEILRDSDLRGQIEADCDPGESQTEGIPDHIRR